MASEEEVRVNDSAATGEESVIKLDKGTYEALLDRIAELESLQVTRPAKSDKTDLDELVEDVRVPHREESGEQVNIDEMSNAQLVDYIFQEINKQAGERLLKLEAAVQTLSLVREIDKCEQKYSDFWKYSDEIKELCANNPSLSVERAYKLAKAEQPAKGETSEGERVTRTEKLLRLPPRPVGEKPGSAPGATQSSARNVSLKDAATKAWEEVVGKGKGEV